MPLSGRNSTYRPVRIWPTTSHLLSDDGPELSGWATLTTVEKDDGKVRALQLKGRKDVPNGWQLPTLLLQANMNVDLLRPYWPQIVKTADIAIAAPNQRIHQVINKTYAKNLYDLTSRPSEDDDDDPEAVPLTDQQVKARKAHLRDLGATINSIGRAFALVRE